MSYRIKFLFLLSLSIHFFVNAQNPIRFIHAYGNFSYNYGMCVHQEPDSGYVILANVSGNLGNNNIYMLKISKTGAYIWDKLFSDSALYWAEGMTQTPDNGFLITGYSNKNDSNAYDIVVIKTDNNGNKEWEKFYGGNDWDLGSNTVLAHDGQYLVCGSTYSYGLGHTDMWLAKMNLIGDTLWTRTFGGEYEDVATCLALCSNGDILMSGYTKSFGAGGYDALLVRYDSLGNYLWHQTFGANGNEKIFDVYELYNNDIVMGGHTSSYGNGGDDYYLIYANQNGIEQFYRADGGPDDERALTMALTMDSGYVLSGLTAGPGYQDLYFYKMKPDGSWHYSTSHGSPYQEYGNCIKPTLDSGYIIVGSTNGFGGCLSNILVIKTGPDGLSEPYNSIAENNNIYNKKINIYPNPFSSETTIEFKEYVSKEIVLEIYNVYGALLHTQIIPPQTHSLTLSRNNLPAGFYNAVLKENNKITGTVKLIVN